MPISACRGGRVKTANGVEDAFTVWAGGTLDGDGHFAEKLKDLTASSEIKFVLEKILRFYQKNALENEKFTAFVNRIGILPLQDIAES